MTGAFISNRKLPICHCLAVVTLNYSKGLGSHLTLDEQGSLLVIVH